MSKMKYFIQQSWLLIVTSFFFGLLIAVANAAWLPKIEQNKIDKINHLLGGLLPEAKKFELCTQLEIESAKGKKEKSNVYKALSETGGNIGWAFTASGPGFADQIELIIAVDAAFSKFAGYAVVKSNETPGFGDKIKVKFFGEQFKNAPVGKLELEKTGDAGKIDSVIIAITGATISSQAVVNIFNTYIERVREQLQHKGMLDGGK